MSVDPPELDEALAAYVSCALWSSTDEAGRPLDAVYGPDDISDEARDEMRADLADFLHLVEREGLELSELEPEQIGHDFWLTRNRHGAGFWDRGLGELGEALTKWAHSYGDSYVYVGDDGRLYVS